ncbi:MAG: beta-lactamase family protein [Defluviitaleaceae bacterium]|nr:beta-lactamase family protein [Defluviitaleaceae bacterium]
MIKKIEEIIPADFRGVVSISKNGESLFKKAYGYADLPNKRANKIDTIFEVASGSKAFVAVGIMKLMEEGKLTLESKLADMLDIDLKAVSPDITVKQLLTHTSGMPDYFDESVMDDMSELWAVFPNYNARTPADMLPTFMDKPMMFASGEKFHYNNAGYVMLALMIEKITGMAFDQYLDKLIFKPCGMKNTAYHALDSLPANCATAYIYDEEAGKYRTNFYSTNVKSDGAGGVYTTVGDIERFWKCFLTGSIVSLEGVKVMTTLHASCEEGSRYGLGFWLTPKDVPFFQGFDPGVSFVTRHHPNGLLTVLVSNYCDNVWKLNRQIEEVINEN